MSTVKKEMPAYRVVTSLPAKAKTVPEFCQSFKGKGCSHENIYKTFRMGRAKDWEIVKFKGINFIIPKNELKMLNSQNINSKGKLQHLVSEDLFNDKLKQVFHAKTGKWLGCVSQPNELSFDETPEMPAEKEQINPSQLNLF